MVLVCFSDIFCRFWSKVFLTFGVVFFEVDTDTYILTF